MSWVNVLDKLRREPFYAAYKTRVIELLAPHRNGVYLEVGAGTGDDARNVATHVDAAVVGMDLSQTMMREAVRRGLPSCVVADVHFLPFAEASFDGCWSDRTFQHLHEPERALDEIVRALKPGGRLVTVDPDYGTQEMEFPDQAVARKVFRFRAEQGLRNGTLAHRMAAIFAAHGLSEVHAERMTLQVHDPSAIDNVMGLKTWARSAASAGEMSETEAAAWERLYDETVAAGKFRYAVTFFLTRGMKH
jgi:ubiquinone/menaquinone biosynthesis C-methylase UbiE